MPMPRRAMFICHLSLPAAPMTGSFMMRISLARRITIISAQAFSWETAAAAAARSASFAFLLASVASCCSGPLHQMEVYLVK